jgi:hypothetical protein
LGDKIEESDPSKNFTIDLENPDKAGFLKEKCNSNEETPS